MKTLTELLACLVAEGGAIVCSSACTEIEIADAQANGRFAVDANGFGYVWRRQAWLDRHAKLEWIANLSELIQDENYDALQPILMDRGWVRGISKFGTGCWSHPEKWAPPKYTLSTESAAMLELDHAFNEIKEGYYRWL